MLFRSKWLKNSEDNFSAELSFIDNYTLKLVKFIISSNESISQLDNPYFLDILQKQYKISCPKTFRYTILPNILEKLKKVIDAKLESAVSVCLIIDLWSAPNNQDFIAVVAVTLNSSMEKNILVIGLRPMPEGTHSSEMVKLVVENIVNDYTFDKLKVKIGRAHV